MNHSNVHQSDRFQQVFEYHQATKHEFQAYASSPGYLVWANPFVTHLPQYTGTIMTEHDSLIIPSEINLHKKSRLLEVAFSDGSRFDYPCEYLRVFSPASMGQALNAPVSGKERLDIAKIEPQGAWLLQLDFDDGYTGSYSWNEWH